MVELTVGQELNPGFICAEFCPLGRVCNGNFGAMPKAALRDYVACEVSDANPDSHEGPLGGIGQPELRGFIERLDSCVPVKVGEVIVDGITKDLYDCPPSLVNNHTAQFLV